MALLDRWMPDLQRQRTALDERAAELSWRRQRLRSDAGQLRTQFHALLMRPSTWLALTALGCVAGLLQDRPSAQGVRSPLAWALRALALLRL